MALKETEKDAHEWHRRKRSEEAASASSSERKTNRRGEGSCI